MIHLTRDDRDNRYMQIPAPLRRLGDENPLVHDLIHRYVGGQIVSYEEFLNQCILGLAENWERMKKEYIDYRLMTVGPIVVPK